MLSPWQWFLFALVPPAIVLLYFLKLRREPLEVPSTYLWRRTIEDMHVNSLWQRLRQNLLLFLQLLLVGLLMLACLRPSWHSQTKLQDRLVFLIDTSASMTATDVLPNRLAVAKQQVGDLIEQMDPGSAAMIVSFADRANVEQPFTTNKRLLRTKLAAIEPTQRTSDISEALRVAAGLANPGRSGNASAGDVAAAEARPADVFILSDGGFRTVPEFSWGNLNPIYLPIGTPDPSNLAVSAFQATPLASQSDQMEAFAEVENFSPTDANVELHLLLDGELIDAVQMNVKAGQTASSSFRFGLVESGVLTVELNQQDDLEADNRGFATLNPPRRAHVLVVTDGNDPLELALATENAHALADTHMIHPDAMSSQEYLDDSRSGKYDLIIYDRCQPQEMPNSDTFFLATIPPGDIWQVADEIVLPTIIDVDQMHPLMKYLAFRDVRIVRANPLIGPPGSQSLMESEAGALCAIAPRDGFEDLVLGFALVAVDQEDVRYSNTDWPVRVSFPTFCRNLLSYFSLSENDLSQQSILPGAAVSLRLDNAGDTIDITSPNGVKTRVVRDRNNSYVFGQTNVTGVYDVSTDRQNVVTRFPVNLFDATESQIVPQPAFNTKWNQVESADSFAPTRRDAWRWIIGLSIVVLMVEWYIFNRRVYV